MNTPIETGRDLPGAPMGNRRALRRHHRRRMIDHARAVLRSLLFDAEWIDRDALRRHGHLAKCSCPMCGNPRRFFGQRTMQEQRVACLPPRGGRGRIEEEV